MPLFISPPDTLGGNGRPDLSASGFSQATIGTQKKHLRDLYRGRVTGKSAFFGGGGQLAWVFVAHLGVCATKAERVCRVVFPGVGMCSPFEGFVDRWVGGEGSGFKKTARGGQPVGLPNSWGQIVFTA